VTEVVLDVAGAPPLILYVNGAVPVKLIVRFAVWPAQIAVVPLIVAVGAGLIVTVAVPDPVPVQFASLSEVIV
jgi:hypothetical protein